MATRRVDELFWPGVRSGVIINFPAIGTHRRHPTTRPYEVAAFSDLDRPRRDIQRPAGADVPAVNCAQFEAIGVHNQPRSQAQWRPQTLSCGALGCRRLGSCASAQALQAGRQCLSLPTARQHMLACVRGGDISQADPQVVPATNRRLADARTSQ
jgi:hypothetical protein